MLAEYTSSIFIQSEGCDCNTGTGGGSSSKRKRASSPAVEPRFLKAFLALLFQGRNRSLKRIYFPAKPRPILLQVLEAFSFESLCGDFIFKALFAPMRW